MLQAPSEVSGAAVPAIGPSRRLLARLRDIMAGTSSLQTRLDKIVRLLAAEMVAEVCSCYVLRPGDVLELYATVGLNPNAVHRTRLRSGEGLVGEIAASAQPLAIEDAPNHPSFAYRPETGEDPYRSLMGAPILRGGRVRGVVVIQNRRRRSYSEEEIELLQTVAMVLAELFAVGEMAGGHGPGSESLDNLLPTRLDGYTINHGLARGLAIPHRPKLTTRQMVAEDPQIELDRFRRAVAAMHQSIDVLLARADGTGIEDTRDILESYRMFAEDRGWLGRIAEAINAGLTAEGAVQRVQNDMAVRMGHVVDPYIREKLLDFDDLANRLLLHLSGRTSAAAGGTLPEQLVLVARAIGPAELLEYDPERLKALVLEDGSPTSHVAIVARALGIPVIGRCQGIMAAVEPFDPVIVDADNGQVFVRPAEDVQELFAVAAAERAEQRRLYAEAAHLPAVTRDGVRISLNINAGLLLDLPHLSEVGADGVGLYRTEIPFLVRAGFPDVPTQTELYAKVLDQAAGHPVTFRTLDVGGDKMLPYFGEVEQGNPALGWRAIRIGLDRPAMLRQQLRALIRAADGRPVGIMFPMIAEVSEYDAARGLLERELRRAATEGRPVPSPIRVGAMLEVPSLIFQLPRLLRRVDFVAVGSNDLMQYLFACDRSNPRLAERFDALSPALLTALRGIVEECDAAGVPVSLCGEMAGRPLEAMVLVALGFRSLSMPSAAVGAVRSMVRSLDVARLRRYVEDYLAGAEHSLRARLYAYARDHGIKLQNAL